MIELVQLEKYDSGRLTQRSAEVNWDSDEKRLVSKPIREDATAIKFTRQTLGRADWNSMPQDSICLVTLASDADSHPPDGDAIASIMPPPSSFCPWQF